MNDPRGSIWRKWDLHVHTPASIINNYSDPDPWERFIRELEQLPPEFKVIGVNDYLFLEGYKYLLFKKQEGRLQNIDLILPVIELRIDKFGGTAGHLSRINYHIIFSNEIAPEVIEHRIPKRFAKTIYHLPSVQAPTNKMASFCRQCRVWKIWAN